MGLAGVSILINPYFDIFGVRYNCTLASMLMFALLCHLLLGDYGNTSLLLRCYNAFILQS